MLSGEWTLGWSVVVLLLAGAVTVWCSVRLAGVGDTLADRTGWGEAVFGAVLFGLVTSLSGIVMTTVAAVDGEPRLAYGNAVGGIAAQTLAVVAADAFHRRANLEHAAASLQNLLFGVLLAGLLGLSLMATFSPDVTVAGVHPASIVLVLVYIGGLHLVRRTDDPMWQAWEAVRTKETVEDVPDEEPEGTYAGRRTGTLWVEFGAIAGVVIVAGWAVTQAAQVVLSSTGLRAGLVGAGIMGIINALPEAVTSIAAVRRGAVTLAFAAIIGGNCLDVLNLAIGDLAYSGGSLFHAAGRDELFLSAAALLMTTVVLVGLLVRQKTGWLRLGFDGWLLVVVYAGTMVTLAV
ncbi:cation transporter [Streptomyces albidoflavus]|uniref:sodium:calcium antiporter n=1 Tax=Streptomyces albidoflavus TaxID=1886 RepID=UPI0034507FDF